MTKKQETSEGTRKNAGAKPKYSEQTKTVASRCPISKIPEIKGIVNYELAMYNVR